jgi:hypothetical protein
MRGGSFTSLVDSILNMNHELIRVPFAEHIFRDFVRRVHVLHTIALIGLVSSYVVVYSGPPDTVGVRPDHLYKGSRIRSLLRLYRTIPYTYFAMNFLRSSRCRIVATAAVEYI